MTTGRVNIGSGAGLNIFTQMSEPATKEGIWVQTSNKYTKVLSPDKMISDVSWVNNSLGEFANVPYSAQNHVAVRVGNRVYVMGGQTQPQNQNWCYDLDTNTWIQKAGIPIAMYNMTAAVHGTTIYLMGGNAANNDRSVYKYDTVNNLWTSAAAIPNTSNANQSAVTVGNFIYLIGASGSYARMQIYDAINNTWSTKTNIPESNWQYMRAIVYGGDIYVFGGMRGSGYLDKVYKYVIATDTWTLIAYMPYTVAMHAVVLAEDRAYIFGGFNGAENIATTYEYNFQTNSFKALTNMPFAVREHEAIYYNQRIHVFGGIGYPTYQQVLRLQPTVFPEKTFVLFRDAGFGGEYKTELVSPPLPIQGINTRILTGFKDAWLYVNGSLQEYPTYYGDGTRWIKYKN